MKSDSGRTGPSDTCVYDVYARVFERVSWLVENFKADELTAAAANLKALAGPSRVAAELARIDAERRRPARDVEELCCAVCEVPCERHPRYGGMSGTAEPAVSFLAHVVLRALDVAPETVDHLARETRLLPGVVDAVLAELRAAGRAIEVEPGRWKAMR
jgi:hypothetical protein